MRAVVVILTIVGIIVSIGALYEVESSLSDGMCNVAVLPIEGTILPFYGLVDVPLTITPEVVENFMFAAEDEATIQAVLIEVNSPGGTPVASQRIAERIRASSLPAVGLIGDVGASGGYMVAAATDYLIASAMSDVGSIGVSMSYLEESQKNEAEGLTYVQLTTGKFKDIGSPNRPITDEERELLQKDLDIVHEEFISLISRYRDMNFDAVEILADGSTMTGKRALENNLIDEVGGRAEATFALAAILGIDPADITYCEYKRNLLPF